MFDVKEILQLSVGLDEHLRKLEGFISILRDVKTSLDELLHSKENHYLYELEQLKKHVAGLTEQLEKRGLPHTNQYEKDLIDLRQILEQDKWPNAVDPTSICDDDEKANLRAEFIIDLLVAERFKDKAFLDYGCGQGHTIIVALERDARFAYGYDLSLKELKFPKDHFTSNFDDVRAKGPYDIILVHDVLDHIMMIDPIAALLQIKSVLSKNGRVYVRNHPWSARHGGHLYMQKNKAFLHLICDDTELVRINGLQCEHNIRVTTPLETYRYWFQEAGFKIIRETPIRDQVEEIFLTPSVINNRLRSKFSNPENMINNLEISFVEYVLEPLESNHQIF